ncbi:leucine-rich repeat protein [Erwinia sp. CPCC 100877]|nr:leucine-rich repeat protein [Erwinia sp. CPCC 100877]
MMLKKLNLVVFSSLFLLLVGFYFPSRETVQAVENTSERIDGIEYTYDTETKFATLTYIETENDMDVVIPATIEINGETYTVNKIGSGEDLYEAPVITAGIKLSSLTFPETIEIIDDWAFSGLSINRLVLPQGLKIIGNSSFTSINSSKIGEIVLPDTLVSIGNQSFLSSGIANISFSTTGGQIIPPPSSGETVFFEGLQSIGDNAFTYNNLTGKIVLPESLVSLGSFVFAGCTGVQSVQLPSHFTSTTVGMMSQTGLTTLDFLADQPNITRIDDFSFQANSYSVIRIPNQITEIGFGAFSTITSLHTVLGYDFLEEVYVSNQVIAIGTRAFNEQPLQFITVPLGQAEDLKTVLDEDALLGVTEATILREEDQDHYSSETKTSNDLTIGDSLDFSVISRNKYQWNLATETLDPYQPQIQWYKDGQPLAGANSPLLSLSDVTMVDAGIYYAVVDGVQQEDLVVRISEQQEENTDNPVVPEPENEDTNQNDSNQGGTAAGNQNQPINNEADKQQQTGAAADIPTTKNDASTKNLHLPNTGEQSQFWGLGFLLLLVVFSFWRKKKAV